MGWWPEAATSQVFLRIKAEDWEMQMAMLSGVSGTSTAALWE